MHGRVSHFFMHPLFQRRIKTAQEGPAFPRVCGVTGEGMAELGQLTAVPHSDVFSVSLLFAGGNPWS